MCFLWSILLIFFTRVFSLPVTIESKHIAPNITSTSQACFQNFDNSRGSMWIPASSEPFECEWNIEVARGYVIELQGEPLNLPLRGDQQCWANIEISYRNQQDKDVKRNFCSYDLEGGVRADSQSVRVRIVRGTDQGELENHPDGFRMNYRAVPVRGPNNTAAVTIVLIAFCSTLVLFACGYCVRNHLKSVRSRNMATPGVLPPNAPTRADLQAAFLRAAVEIRKNDEKYLSRTTDLFSSKRPVQHPHAPPSAPARPAQRKLTIETTPVFPETWCENKLTVDSVRKMALEKVRTRLVARFSSVSSSVSGDISYYFDASESRNYSRLSCDGGDLQPPKQDARGEQE